MCIQVWENRMYKNLEVWSSTCSGNGRNTDYNKSRGKWQMIKNKVGWSWWWRTLYSMLKNPKVNPLCNEIPYELYTQAWQDSFPLSKYYCFILLNVRNQKTEIIKDVSQLSRLDDWDMIIFSDFFRRSVYKIYHDSNLFPILKMRSNEEVNRYLTINFKIAIDLFFLKNRFIFF